MGKTRFADDRFTVQQLMEVLSTGNDPLPDRESNRLIMFYEWSDNNPLRYDEIDWNGECVLFSLGTSCMKTDFYLIPKFAYAEVSRIWAVEGEPIKVMIIPKEDEE